MDRGVHIVIEVAQVFKGGRAVVRLGKLELLCICMRLGLTKNLVLPLPEPPITSTFLFRAVLGSLGLPFIVSRSVCVSRMLFSNTGSM